MLLRPAPPRQGIALVLSLIILVMMLMLGLPFLLSQSASIQSSDQFAHNQEAANARESVEALGLGLASDSYSPVWLDPDNHIYHALYNDSTAIIDPSASLDLGNTRVEGVSYPLRVYYDLKAIRKNVWVEADNADFDLELIIEDESGKLDINGLSRDQWIALMSHPLVGVNYNINELANGFINFRINTLKGKPFTALEQLLLANPSGSTPPTPPRPPLTHAELDRIRPYVTVHGMGQGKDGYQELGNAIVVDDPASPGDRYAIIDIHPSENPLPGNTFTVFGEDPDIWTSANSVSDDFIAVSTPMAQALNINTASYVALNIIGIANGPSGTGPTGPLESSGERVVFTKPDDLPVNLHSHLAGINDNNPLLTSDDRTTIPISLTSSGVVSIRSRAHKYNRANRPAAASARAITALALSSRAALEKLLDDQVAMHLNLASRMSSLISSWPRAIERRVENNPPLGADWEALEADPDNTTDAAMQSRPLPDIHDLDIFPDGGWTKRFERFDEDIPSGFNLEDDVSPEGIKVSNGQNLVYDHERTVDGDKTSFAEPHFDASGDPQQMQARQISFWITTPEKSTFDSTWVDKTVPIFELRAPEENTGSPIDPSGPNDGHSAWDIALSDARCMDYRETNGDNSKQHYLGMYYDGTTDLEHLVLSVAGEIIEIPDAPFGAPFHPQDLSATPSDDRTMAGGTHPLSNPQRLTWSEHRYIYKLQPDRAYHVTVILHNTRPGGMQIIVDGLVGRDLTKLADLNVSAIKQGDHFTTPYPLRLTTGLPELTQSMSPGNKAADEAMREVGSITARGLNLPGAWSSILASPSDWLPDNTNGNAHGMMNVNGEFIAYKNWTESGGIYTFNECKRGCRQLVNDQDEIGKSYTSHGVTFTIPAEPGMDPQSYRRNMPAHAAQSEVWPGGLSFERDTTLYRGGCVLMTPMGNNTPIRSESAVPLSSGDTSITVTDASLFPDRGVIKVRGRGTADDYPPADTSITYDHDGDPGTAEVPMVAGDGVNEDVIEIMYYEKVGNTLNLLQRGMFGAGPYDFAVPDPANSGDRIKVLLASWEVETDPTGRYRDPGAGTANTLTPGYNQGDAPDGSTDIDNTTGQYDAPPARSFANWIPHARLQLYDVTDPSSPSYGAIEWINYTDIEVIPASVSASGSDEYYFLNRNGGYGAGRGVLGTHYDAARIWPPGTRILPVQTAGKFGYLMEAGDVVTLSARQLGAATVNYRDAGGVQTRQFSTWQTVIRYSSHNTHDHYSWVDSGSGWGPVFHYPKEVKFAFTEELPEFPTNAMVSIWPSWSNKDLTLYNLTNISPNQFNASNLPFVNAWATGFNTDDRRVYFGTQDSARLPAVNNMPGTVNDAEAHFDSVAAITPISGTDHQITTILAASGSGLGAEITVSTSNSGFSNTLSDRSGIILINGEAIAYIMRDPPSGGQAVLEFVGRGLLGSEQAPVITVGDEVLRLPFGPVAQLEEDMDADHAGIIDLTDVNGIGNDTQLLDNVHSFLLVKPDGSSHEMVQLLPEKQRWHTAPWLRGMYNTPVQDWQADDLVLAWTPRFASALPKDDGHLSTTELRSALLRSRSFAWIGAPLRIFGLEMPGTAADPSAEIILKHNTDVPFDFEVRALDSGFDWDGPDALIAQTPAPLDGSQLNLPAEFTSTWEPEGGDFELRLHWRYTTDAFDPSDEAWEQLQALAASSNSAPSIKSLSLNGQSGIQILDAEVKN